MSLESYCSWCFQKTIHKLHEQNYIRRNTYICESCKNHTLECRYCKNMAMGKPNIHGLNDSEIEKISKIGNNWDNELCAEHDGTIASFETLDIQLDDIEDYEKIFEKATYNLGKAGKISAIALGSAALFTPIAFAAAPAFASAAGSLGLLGAASTGTAISTLSGAALTSASLAAVGGGTMATGTAFIVAAGAALGSYQGGVIGNSYFGEIKNFEIRKQNEGYNNHNIIYINGFLSQDEEDFRDWTKNLKKDYVNTSWYGIKWESKARKQLGKSICLDATGNGAIKYAKILSKRAAKEGGKKLNPLIWAKLLTDAISNPWHSTMVKAAMTGILLADLISRNKDQTFTLMGHSLGCRVIYYVLETLSTKEKKFIKDVYLLGGAVDRKDSEGWTKACESVSGNIYNCHSQNDFVLKYLYKGASALFSDPIGYDKIKVDNETIKNIDCTEFVNSHMEWKNNLSIILEKIKKEHIC